jgi:hypothetical protein
MFAPAAFLVLLAPMQDAGDENRLEMSEPIACRSVRGYEDYEPLDEPVVPRTEKLLIYTRPTGHAYAREEGGYRFHLVQDVNVRRKGEKKVLWGRKRIVEYADLSPRPPVALYLSTSLGLKEFPPGEYEADLILHDLIGKAEPARRTLAFRLVDSAPTATDSQDDRVTPPATGARAGR